MSDPRKLPAPPPERVILAEFDQGNLRETHKWLVKIHQLLSTAIGLAWAVIDKSGASIADIPNRDHGLLTGLGDDDHPQYQKVKIPDIAASGRVFRFKGVKIVTDEDGNELYQPVTEEIAP